LEKWATPLILKIDVGLYYVTHRMGANEADYLKKANSINDGSTVGTKLKSKEDRENRQNLDKTELDPSRKYNVG
jgi:hypothetical protein